ncbi:glutaredoxin family protein [Candidatus Acetothermia bacterium]|nr:glutaredoxin family protein [Candidatus Acetothermia bacterium]
MTKKVELYTKPGCPGSEAVRAYLDQHGIPYTEWDIAVDPQAQQQLQVYGSQTTPTIVVDGDAIIGFTEQQKQQLDQLLEQPVS